MTVWEDRFQALEESIKGYRTLLGKVGWATAPRQKTLLCLLERLQAFGSNQFKFFNDGFTTHTGYKLKPSDGFPAEFVFKVTLDQIESDLAVIERIVSQRVLGGQVSTEITGTLDQADKLAMLALQPFSGAGHPIEDGATTVVTYFNKYPSIRIVPYAPVMVIGIPYSARNMSIGATVFRDLLGLTHEVGHYVYRRGSTYYGGQLTSLAEVLGQRLAGLPDIPDWVLHWKEEIFADVFGCLVAGPVMGLSGQDLALTSSVRASGKFLGDFIRDDGEHPVPAVRPYLYIDMLARRNYPISSQKLDERWCGFVGKRSTTVFKPYHSGANVRIPVPEARTAINAVVGQVLDILLPYYAPAPTGTWTTELAAVDDVEILYTQFKDTITNLVSKMTVSDLPDPCLPAANLWEEWIKQEKFFPSSSDLLPPKVPEEIEAGLPGKSEDLEQEPGDTWNKVLVAGGWTTRVGNHNGGS